MHGTARAHLLETSGAELMSRHYPRALRLGLPVFVQKRNAYLLFPPVVSFCFVGGGGTYLLLALVV